jgi:hypothetical protein
VIREASLLPPFVSPRPAARWATGLLVTSIAVAWIALGVELALLRLLLQARHGQTVAALDRGAQSLTAEFMLTLEGLVFVATAVAFLIWLFQVRVNVRSFGARRLEYPRSWIVAGFLIPVMNFFRPYQVVREVWRASDPQTLDPFNWKGVGVSPLLGLWWASCVAFGSLALLALLTYASAGMSLTRIELTTALRILTHAAAAVSACLSCFVVSRISDAQEEKWERQVQEGAEAQPA